MDTYKLYSAGHFITSNKTLEVKNPFDHSLVATIYLANEIILEDAITKALSVKEELGNLSSQKKYDILKQISDEVYANRNYLANILSLESAKPLKYALAEIDRSAYTFLIAAEESLKDRTEELDLERILHTDQKKGIVSYFPIGLIAGIAPFNFPMNLAVHKLAPAIASGCPIILKPASRTPLSCLELAKIIDKTDLPKGAVSVLPTDRTTGNLLVTDERFKLLSFTGSPDIGWKMKQQSGKKKVVLELGGNAATIITPSADLKDALTKSLMGAFSYSGQICIHAQRFIVHSSIYQTFIDELKAQTLQLKYGNPSDASTDISNMIDEANAIRVESWIKEALQQSAQLICGGKRTGSYVEPTILTHCNHNMKVYAEEVFGPVICINSYETIEEAIHQANNTKFGLQCGVFTNDTIELNNCFKHIEVGGVIHNHVPTLRYDQMPYGGVKESGLGREGVKYAMLDMLEPKILVK
ncbi:MAG: aldehyde dehydrogenase family protein [Bacteroidetes bacterium]|nr:aldehyde dehydrogenase family protein [Bacteroidota bacterium]